MNTIHIDKNLLKLSNLEVSNQDVKDHKIGQNKINLAIIHRF